MNWANFLYSWKTSCKRLKIFYLSIYFRFELKSLLELCFITKTLTNASIQHLVNLNNGWELFTVTMMWGVDCNYDTQSEVFTVVKLPCKALTVVWMQFRPICAGSNGHSKPLLISPFRKIQLWYFENVWYKSIKLQSVNHYSKPLSFSGLRTSKFYSIFALESFAHFWTIQTAACKQSDILICGILTAKFANYKFLVCFILLLGFKNQ